MRFTQSCNKEFNDNVMRHYCSLSGLVYQIYRVWTVKSINKSISQSVRLKSWLQAGAVGQLFGFDQLVDQLMGLLVTRLVHQTVTSLPGWLQRQ